MTDLRKTIRRRTVRAASNRGKRFVVSLHPGDLIELREERSKTGFTLPLEAVFELAVRAEVRRIDRERKEAKKTKKGSRHD
jgi:hypothetical protein